MGRSAIPPPTVLRIGDDIVFEEDISSGADAKTVIEVRDGSTFEVGPDAVIRIDEFVFNPEASAIKRCQSPVAYSATFPSLSPTTRIPRRRLPPPAILRSRPAPGDQQLRREVTANLLPTAQQLNPSVRGDAVGRFRCQLADTGRSGAPPLGGGRRTICLTEPRPAERRSSSPFLHGSGSTGIGSPLGRRRTVASRIWRQLGHCNGYAGVATVAPSADVQHQVAVGAARANPAAAGIITRTSLAAYRGPDRAEDLFHHMTAAPARTGGLTAADHTPASRAARKPEERTRDSQRRAPTPGQRPDTAGKRSPADTTFGRRRGEAKSRESRTRKHRRPEDQHLR
jgi:hypothetical protein